MQPRRYKDDVADRRDSREDGPSPSSPQQSAAGAAPPNGPYQLMRAIGSGASSTVYEARLTRSVPPLESGDVVAVKFLRPELVADPGARRRLASEGRLGMSIQHPNVARIYAVESDADQPEIAPCLIMQFVQGTTLRELLKKSGAPLEDLTRRLGADAARGLFALHRRGLVHRDVKPENLILTPDSELKIVDLGLVRPFDSQGGGASPGVGSASDVGLAGSVAYCAPETLLGQRAGPRSDLYSLGVVLYEVTTGEHPFVDADGADEMMDAHLRRAPPKPSHLRPRVSPLLEQLVMDLMAKDPDDRPRSAADVVRILDQGERSDFWRKHELAAPVLASNRRLMRMRRPTEAPFVGRKDETAALDRALAKARAGEGRALAIVAPASTGKRRLLDECMQRWLQSDAPPRYLGGDADSGLAHGEPFASTLLDLLLRGDDPDTPNSRARALTHARDRFELSEPDAAALVAVVFGDSTESPEVRADRLATALLTLPAPERPLVVRVDHAEDLDTSGRLVLQRLVAAAATTHLLVLLAAGPDTELVSADHRLELSGLDDDAFFEFGRALFRSPVKAHVDGYLRDAHQMLSGLPGSLLEALEHLVDCGDLRGRAGDYHDLSMEAEPVPAPRHVERFRQRVESLDPAHRAALSAAAVLGDRCRLADLSALILQPELAVLETLSLFRGRIVSSKGGEVTFRHRDFRRALLTTLPNEEQQRLHAAAASVLEARGAPSLVVGMHRSQALDHEGCLEPLLDALAVRVRAASRRTALRIVGRLSVHFRHAPATEAHERMRMQFLLLSGQAHQNADQRDQAVDAYRRAEQLARRLGATAASAEARIGLATDAVDNGRMLAAITLLETVHRDLDLAERDKTSASAKAHALHGRIMLYLGQSAECTKHLLAAKKAVPADELELQCDVWIDLARAEGLAHRYATAARTLRNIEKAYPIQEVPRSRLRFHLYRGQLRTTLGEPDAGQDLRLAVDEAQRLALPVYGARAALFLGERAFLRDRDDEARRHFSAAVVMSDSADDRLAAALARSHLVRLGERDEDLIDLINDLDLPELHATWLLATAAAGAPVTDAAAQLDQLLKNADLPLALHLRALAWLDRPASARSLVRRISERFDQRAQRKRFRQQWQGRVRV